VCTGGVRMHVLLHIGESETDLEVWQQETTSRNVLSGQEYAFCKLQIG
jgi:hypothetical protein